MEFRTKSGVTTTRYLLAGNNWNTEAQTDELGNITRTYLVDPFGTFKVYTGAGVDGKWFTTDDVVGDPANLEGERVLQGLPWYGSTGLYHLRNRWYSPTLQRFLSMDPLGFDAGDANLYRFEGNDPLGNLDPMGAVITRTKVIRAGMNGLGLGVGTGLAARAFPRFSRAAGVLAIPLGIYMVGGLLEKSAQIYTGLESGTMRKLCPQEIDARQDDLILGAIENAFAAVGAAFSGPLYDGIVSLAGKFTALGEEVSAAEALAGISARSGEGSQSLGHSYAASVSPGGTGSAFAGHGELRWGSGTTVVPEGTTVSVWGEHGKTISDPLGRLVEKGAYEEILATPGLNTTGARTYLAGSEMPNYSLLAPGHLNILANSRTVEDATALSELLRPNMGHLDWAACLINAR